MSKKNRRKRNYYKQHSKRDDLFNIASWFVWMLVAILAIYVAVTWPTSPNNGSTATPPLVGDAAPSVEGDKNPEQDKNIGDDQTNEPIITKAPDPLAEPQYIDIVFDPESFIDLKEKTDWLRDRLDIGDSDLIISLEVTTFTDPLRVLTLNGEGPFTLQRKFKKRVEIPSDESAPLETGTTPAPPAAVDNKTLPSEESSSVADSTLSGEGDKNSEQDKYIGDNQTNEPSITNAPDPPPEQKFRIEDSFETVEQFEDIFNSPTDKNPGVGGLETFRLKVNPEVRSSQYQYKISIAYNGSSIDSLPEQTVFSAKEVSVIKEDSANKSIQISLIDLPEWSFKQVEFSEVVLFTRVDLEGNKKKYIELNNDGDSIGTPIRRVQETQLLYKGLVYCTTTLATEPLSQLWLPVLESTATQERVGTSFRIIGAIHFDMLHTVVQGSSITAELRKEKESLTIDPLLHERVLEATDYITKERIANMNNRIQYVMDSKDKLIGFSLSKKQNQIDYYPITRRQAEWMMNNGQGIISFHPRYIDARVQIVDAVTKSDIQDVQFKTDANAFNQDNKPVSTINNVTFANPGYRFTINFAEPSSDVADWKVTTIYSNATNYVNDQLTTQEVGRMEGELPVVYLQPEPRNIVIVIPQSEQFRAQFDYEWQEGEFNREKTNGSKNEVTGNTLYVWKGEKGELGLVPRFVKTLKDTLLQQFRSTDTPDSLKNTEIDVYIYGNEEITEYSEKTQPIFKGKSINLSEMLSGGRSDAYSRLSHRFGKRTTLIALVGGGVPNATDKYYIPTESNLGDMQIVLFTHKFDPDFENAVNFAENNSGLHHVIDEPNNVDLLCKRAADIAAEVYNEFIKE
jgi:hypothetical protein